MSHKTLYLKATTKTGLIADIAQLFEGFDAEIEFSNGEVHGHYIGQIADTFNTETGEVLTWKDGYHANLFAPTDFDETIFSTLVIPPPHNPVHRFS